MPKISGALRVVFAALVLAAIPTSFADEKEKPQPNIIQAQTLGQGTQLGATFNITINIESFSTPDERQDLIDAFDKAGSQGLSNALFKMPSKGRMAITGTLGYDISYIRKIKTDNGITLRVLTNRPIAFGESWYSTRSEDYNLSAMEINLSDQKDKSTGTLLPACMFKVDKKTNEVVIEDYRNPWKLVNIQDRSSK